MLHAVFNAESALFVVTYAPSTLREGSNTTCLLLVMQLPKMRASTRCRPGSSATCSSAMPGSRPGALSPSCRRLFKCSIQCWTFTLRRAQRRRGAMHLGACTPPWKTPSSVRTFIDVCLCILCNMSHQQPTADNNYRYQALCCVAYAQRQVRTRICRHVRFLTTRLAVSAPTM
jgi:hypothetical protein